MGTEKISNNKIFNYNDNRTTPEPVDLAEAKKIIIQKDIEILKLTKRELNFKKTVNNLNYKIIDLEYALGQKEGWLRDRDNKIIQIEGWLRERDYKIGEMESKRLELENSYEDKIRDRDAEIRELRSRIRELKNRLENR